MCVPALPGSSTPDGVIRAHEKAPHGRRVGRRPRGFRRYVLQVLPYAARTVERNLSTSSLRWRLSVDSDCAEDRTCVEAEPVSAAPRFTSVMFDATIAVPLAASPTLRAIS